MKKFMKLFGVVGIIAALSLCGGCGDEDVAPKTVSAQSTNLTVTPSATTPGKAVVSSTQTLSLSSATTDPAFSNLLQITIPAGTTITATDVSGNPMTIPPVVTFYLTQPIDTTVDKSGVSGVPVQTGFGYTSVQSTMGALQISGPNPMATATFDQDVTVTIPVHPNPGQTTIDVFFQPIGESGYPLVTHNVPISTINGVSTVSVKVRSLGWIVAGPVFVTASGSTGGTGGGL